MPPARSSATTRLIKVSKAMALTAFDLMTDADLMARAKKEHANWESQVTAAV